MATSNMENSKKEKYRERPTIPVRSNRRTNFVRMSQMHGDKLPELRDVEKPEFSNRTRHFNGLVKTHMWKDVNLMYKEHIITMNKVKRSQDQVFKLLCKVTKEKRVVQRQEYARRRAEARAKFSSQRMLLLVQKVVQKFKENVKRKQTLRAEEEKRNSVFLDSIREQDTLVVSDNGKRTSDKSSTIAETRNVEPDTKTRDASISKGKDKTKNTNTHQTRSNSAEGNKKKKPLYTVQTAENRTRFGTSILDTGSTQLNDIEDKSEEIQMGRLPTVAVEVSKDTEHRVRLKRAGSDQDEFFKLCNRRPSVVTLDSASSNPESTTTGSRQVSFNIANENSSINSDTDESSPQPPVYFKMDRNRRKSLFDPIDLKDDEGRDFGWFTFGNPNKKEKKTKHVDTDSLDYSHTNSKSRGSQVTRRMSEKQKSVMFKDETECRQEVPDTKKENDLPYSLPPVRTRKIATTGGPPLDLLLENNSDISKASASGVSDAKLETSTSKDKPTHDGNDQTKPSHLETAKLDTRVVKSKVNFESTDRSNINNPNGDDFAIWYPVSSKEKKTYFVEPLKTSKKKSSLQVTESSSAEDKTVEEPAAKPAVKRKDALKSVKERESKFIEDEMSANYSWVLKQEEKYKKSRHARILDKEEVRRYKVVSHNKLVSELVPKTATKFVPPSHKELYLQKKLERKNQDDILKQRLRIAHFHRTITVGFELDNTPKRPSDAQSPNSQFVPSMTTNVEEPSRIHNVFDIFKDEGLRLTDKEDSMARIRYIRNDSKFMSHRKPGERRTSMWNLQDPNKLKIFKGYA